jgi:hypothetical protein
MRAEKIQRPWCVKLRMHLQAACSRQCGRIAAGLVSAIPICGTALRSRCSIVDIPRAGAPICPAFLRSIGLLALMTFATGGT